jgi:hypothetical protein
LELGCTHEEAGLSRGAPYAEKVGSRITDRMQAAEVVTIRYNCGTVAPESNRRLPRDTMSVLPGGAGVSGGKAWANCDFHFRPATLPLGVRRPDIHPLRSRRVCSH